MAKKEKFIKSLSPRHSCIFFSVTVVCVKVCFLCVYACAATVTVSAQQVRANPLEFVDGDPTASSRNHHLAGASTHTSIYIHAYAHTLTYTYVYRQAYMQYLHTHLHTDRHTCRHT